MLTKTSETRTESRDYHLGPGGVQGQLGVQVGEVPCPQTNMTIFKTFYKTIFKTFWGLFLALLLKSKIRHGSGTNLLFSQF